MPMKYNFGQWSLMQSPPLSQVWLSSKNRLTSLWDVKCHLLVAVALISDWAQLRGVIILATLPISIAGYAAIANVHSAKVKYGMTFLMASGMYSSVPCILGWNSNNSAGHYKRATTSAMQLAIANCGGFVSSKITLHLYRLPLPLQKKGDNAELTILILLSSSIQLPKQRCTAVSQRPYYHP